MPVWVRGCQGMASMYLERTWAGSILPQETTCFSFGTHMHLELSIFCDLTGICERGE